MDEETTSLLDLERNVIQGLAEMNQIVCQASQLQTRVREAAAPLSTTLQQLVFREEASSEEVDVPEGRLGRADELENTVARRIEESEQVAIRESLKKSASKRAGEPESLHATSEKVPKRSIEEATNEMIQELERALNRNDDNPRVRCLVREIAKTTNLPPNLTMRILYFCVKVGERDVARELLDNQTVDIETREGGELLWTAVEGGQDEIAAMLVRRKADLSVRRFYDDRTLLHHVAKGQYTTERQELFREMLEGGADVNARDKGGRSVLHLLLNLGADLNVTDHEGRTPFCYTDDSPQFNATDALLVKHFALTVARDGKMSYEDMQKINKHAWSERLFGNCTMQLERMRMETICEDVSYFGLLSWEMFGKMRLMEKPNFAKTFIKNKKKRANRFPQYPHMLLHSFEIAKKRYETLQVKKEQLRECFSGITDDAIEHIMLYSNSENLSSYRHDYYMALYASLKSTEADKRKIV